MASLWNSLWPGPRGQKTNQLCLLWPSFFAVTVGESVHDVRCLGRVHNNLTSTKPHGSVPLRTSCETAVNEWAGRRGPRELQTGPMNLQELAHSIMRKMKHDPGLVCRIKNAVTVSDTSYSCVSVNARHREILI